MGVQLHVRGARLGDPKCLHCDHRGYHAGRLHEYDPDYGSDVLVEYRIENEDGSPAGGWRPVDFRRSLTFINHSPTGFGWGYAGSGPAQLAFAILETCVDQRDAQKHHQRFKDATVARVADQHTPFEFRVDVERFLIARDEPNTVDSSLRHVEYIAGFTVGVPA